MIARYQSVNCAGTMLFTLGESNSHLIEDLLSPSSYILKAITNCSGHYKPHFSCLTKIIDLV